ncbi:MAG: 50S ribosome-binding GTPase [Nanoarchaeota archaeon]|nr:50S ribosome-binding GTPase [Nanoarchaeota archaeon]
MPINAHPDYLKAEKEYLQAESLEDKIFYLEEMIRRAPSHKGGENLRVELKARLKKLVEKSEKARKKAGGKKGIRKEGFQFLLIGLTNTGKSSLLSKLTNAKPQIAEFPFTTQIPEIGTFHHEGISAQLIDQPSLGSENFDSGLANNADCLIYVISDFSEIEKIKKQTPRARGRKKIIFNKADLFSEKEIKKLEATIKSKRLTGYLVSAQSEYNLEKLKELMISETGLIRIYMKEPGKPKSPVPMVLKENSRVKDVAEHILKGFSKTVKEIRLTGPSSKFPNQKVGLTHKLKDLDIVEFHTR